MLYAPVPGFPFCSLSTSKGSFLLVLPVNGFGAFFFKLSSASFISYSPTPGLPLSEDLNLGKLVSR